MVEQSVQDFITCSIFRSGLPGPAQTATKISSVFSLIDKYKNEDSKSIHYVLATNSIWCKRTA